MILTHATKPIGASNRDSSMHARRIVVPIEPKDMSAYHKGLLCFWQPRPLRNGFIPATAEAYSTKRVCGANNLRNIVNRSEILESRRGNRLRRCGSDSTEDGAPGEEKEETAALQPQGVSAHDADNQLSTSVSLSRESPFWKVEGNDGSVTYEFGPEQPRMQGLNNVKKSGGKGGFRRRRRHVKGRQCQQQGERLSSIDRGRRNMEDNRSITQNNQSKYNQSRKSESRSDQTTTGMHKKNIGSFFVLLVSRWMSRLYAMMQALWRLLPYRLRALVVGHTTTWPPVYTRRHVVPPLSALLTAKRKQDRPRLQDVGVDTQGRSTSLPLDKLERWRLEELMGTGVCNVLLYRSALTHPTALKPEQRLMSYERLEFLGDSVIELVCRQMLMERNPYADEGILTFQTQAMVKGDSISTYSAWLGLDKWILTNAFSLKRSLLESPSVLGDSFEALVGALYLDKGLRAARIFLERLFLQCPYSDWNVLNLQSNYCTDLIKIAISLGCSHPFYMTLDVEEVHGFPYTVKWTEQVVVNGVPCGIGQAFDQRISQQIAARNTILMLRNQYNLSFTSSSVDDALTC